ncbi:MAG TPA: response regulator transcription factor [Puia sp.]|nr:response regulator transcription factor [Puia sp.]
MIKVAIVEDNASLRNSLVNLFDKSDDIKCVAALDNLRNIVSDIGRAMPDVILMDIGLPNISGIEGVRTVKSNFPSIQIMMFTVFEDEERIFDAIKNGASGYLLKKTPPEEIVAAVKELHHGGAPMSASIARKVIGSFQTPATDKVSEFNLTVREKEILFSLVDGLSYKRIAEKYFISISTIRTHICNIYAKLHVHSKSEAMAKVLGRPTSSAADQ